MTQETTAPKAAAGELTIEEQVVAKIVGGAAKEIEGVHAMGTGSFAERITGAASAVTGEDIKKGVRVEVGKKEVAVDLWLTVEYGVNIPTVVQAARQKITEQVHAMTDLKVIEINADVVDVYIPGDELESRVE